MGWSRENGSWHYYDLGKGDWIAATPPASTPDVPAPPALPSAPAAEPRDERANTAEPRAVHPTPPAADTSEANLPRWAAVKPTASTTAAAAGTAAATPSAGRAIRGQRLRCRAQARGRLQRRATAHAFRPDRRTDRWDEGALLHPRRCCPYSALSSTSSTATSLHRPIARLRVPF